MDKISGILPSNRRIKSVDLDDAHPIRPGVPAFGRPVGPSSVVDRVSLSGTTPDEALKETTYRNPKETARAKMVEEMTSRFFATRVSPAKSDEVMDSMMESDETAPQRVAPREIAESAAPVRNISPEVLREVEG